MPSDAAEIHREEIPVGERPEVFGIEVFALPADPVSIRAHAGVVVEIVRLEEAPDEVRLPDQSIPHDLEVGGGFVDPAEVGQLESVEVQGRDAGDRCEPGFELELRRRQGEEREVRAGKSHRRDVAGEADAFAVELRRPGVMVPRVPRCLDRGEGDVAEVQTIAVSDRVHLVRRAPQQLSEDHVEFVAVDAAGARVQS